MKQIKLFIILLITLTSIISTAQTQINLSNMTDSVTLGWNCSSSQIQSEYIADNALLNHNTINLRNSILRINGNIVGPGQINFCGNSKLCVEGQIIDLTYNPSLLDCSTLSLNTFENLEQIPKNLNYSIYDLNGKLLSKGNTNNLQLLLKQPFLLKVEGYKVKKLYLIK
jgi:phospholipase/lecithinase/hemolysin